MLSGSFPDFDAYSLSEGGGGPPLLPSPDPLFVPVVPRFVPEILHPSLAEDPSLACMERPHTTPTSPKEGDITRSAKAPGRRAKYACDRCKKRFDSIRALTRHTDGHYVEEMLSTKHACPRCKRRFDSGYKLSRHIKTHDESLRSAKYACVHCGKRFESGYKLTRHIRVHTGEKPFQCSECLKFFNQKAALKTHSKIHARRFLQEQKEALEIAGREFSGFTLTELGFDDPGVGALG